MTRRFRGETAPASGRAVALLHSSQFGGAIGAFGDVLAADSTCAMAHWSIALAHRGNPTALGNRAPALLAQGRAEANAAAATRLGGDTSLALASVDSSRAIQSRRTQSNESNLSEHVAIESSDGARRAAAQRQKLAK